MTTPVIPRRRQREKLCRSGWRWLLGQRQRWDPVHYSFHVQIGQWEYLLAQPADRRDWDAYLRRVWRQHRSEVEAWHRRRFPRWKVPRSPEEMEASYRRRHGQRTAFKQWLAWERSHEAFLATIPGYQAHERRPVVRSRAPG
jgi:hypothetical protein